MELSCSSIIASTSDDSKQQCFWKTIWCLLAPHNVRQFLWHACRDILPTTVNLRRQ